VEIDEYRNYEKALAALKEALKAAARIKGDIREARTSSLTGRIAIVERFVAARKLAKTDMPAMAEACRGLLELRDAETAIRVGDVYALLVYYHAQQKQWGVAFDLVEDMRGRGILLEPFIESAVLREIYT
jgi:intraflagellar transport protein 140